MSLVGIIANPASGKDIRRLVAYGSVFDNEEKVRMIRRILLGLSAVGVNEVCYMPDTYGIVNRALSEVEIPIRCYPTPFNIKGDQDDSIRAAGFMAQRKADCIITLGGDGTNRVVVKGSVSVPILPVSTGTNNVFPAMIEGTIAGMAAALIAEKMVPLPEASYRSTILEVVLDGQPADLSLVDVAVYDDPFIGSRAIWKIEKVRQIFLNRAEPNSIGLSSIGGLLHPVSAESPQGLVLELGKGEGTVTAPVAPGLIQTVSIKKKSVLTVGEETDVTFSPAVIALDGERELEIQKGRQVSIRLKSQGPIVVDVHRTMGFAAKNNILTSNPR
ncbi:MAG: NAD(+)/NADH kinase [Deltaproteobacteria bacterium]|nr:NAD(+)/NADH kinase [Deltaproteobacteria bacterium]MBW1962899.1 NAD(+)/NADH kinase [Deltaproteobacteria bacterium]MBW2151603.1 NAD(+)/NADH kinase [Deltaproteobacteria bacterium]